MTSSPNNPNTENPIWRILRNTSWSLVGKGLGAVLSMVYLALVARSLGPTDFGRFALIFSFGQGICALVGFPTWQIILRYGTKHVLDGKADKFAQLTWLCLAMDLAGFTIGALLTAFGLFAFGELFGIDAELRSGIIWFTIILLLSTRSTVIGILRAHDRFRDVALSDSLVPIIRFIGVFIVAYNQPSVEAFLIVWAASEIITTLILWMITLPALKLPLGAQNLRQLSSYYAEYPDITRFTGFTNLGVILRVINQQFVVLMVGLFTGAASAGFFRLGHQLGQVLARVSDGATIAVYAEHSRMTHIAAEDAVASMSGRAIKILAISAAFLLAILMIFGNWLIVTIFGDSFAPAYPFVVLLGGAAAVQLGSSAFEPALMAKGHAGSVLIANMIGAAALLIVFFALIGVYAALGAAVAILVGSIVTAISLGLFYRRLN
jgi:O-antigen/teichoic acid export membrane protein